MLSAEGIQHNVLSTTFSEKTDMLVKVRKEKGHLNQMHMKDTLDTISDVFLKSAGF